MDPYVVLGVTVDCTDEEINKAYRTAAKGCHPDMGGDPVLFAKLACAVSILRDPRKRKLFDDFGVCMDATESYIEKKVLDLFTELANSWIMLQLQSGRDIEITKYFYSKIKEATNSMARRVSEVEARINKLKRRKAMVMILVSKGENLVANMIEGMIISSRSELKAVEEDKYIISLVKEMCAAYYSIEEEEVKATKPYFATTGFGSAFTEEHMKEMLHRLYQGGSV